MTIPGDFKVKVGDVLIEPYYGFMVVQTLGLVTYQLTNVSTGENYFGERDPWSWTRAKRDANGEIWLSSILPEGRQEYWLSRLRLATKEEVE